MAVVSCRPFMYWIESNYRFVDASPSEEVLRFQQAKTHFTSLINQQLEQLEKFDHPEAAKF